MSISRFADADSHVPPVIRRIIDGAPVVPIWVNGDGGVTFRLGSKPSRYAKWAPTGSPIDLAAEKERLMWAVEFVPVPHVLDYAETPTGSYLLTTGLPGDSAITDHWKTQPDQAVRAAGAGLRALHDSLPLDTCPFDWSIAARMQRLASPDAARNQLPPPPTTDHLVVCHGDACVPNTLIDTDGHFVGHVDLGSLGRADRWADLAVATWSTEWNYGPGWEGLFLDAYGIEPDPERTRYYRVLWNLAHPV